MLEARVAVELEFRRWQRWVVALFPAVCQRDAKDLWHTRNSMAPAKALVKAMESVGPDRRFRTLDCMSRDRNLQQASMVTLVYRLEPDRVGKMLLR